MKQAMNGLVNRVLKRTMPGAAAMTAALAVVSHGATLSAQDLTLTAERSLELGAAVSSLSFSADGGLLLVGTDDGDLTLLATESGETLWSHDLADEAGGGTRFAGLAAGDTTAVTVHSDGTILHFRLPSGPAGNLGLPEDVRRLSTGGEPRMAALDAGRRYLAVATSDRAIEIIDLPTSQRIGTIDGGDALDDLLHLGFDRLGRQLQAVTESGRVTAWNPDTGERLRQVTLSGDELQGSRSLIHRVGADRSANVLMVALEEVALPSGGLRGPARPGDLVRRDQLLVFDWHSGAVIKGVPVPDGIIERMAVGPGNDHAVVSHGTDVTMMDLRAGAEGARVSAPADVTALSVSPDNGRLAVGTDGGDLGLWAMSYREPLAADELDQAVPGLAGRMRVLGDDSPAIRQETMDVPVVMAILPFDDRQGDDQMPAMVAELLTTQLANSSDVRLVERLRIESILDEQELQRQGLTEANGIELGRLLNADLILLGSIGAFGTSVTLSARVLDVETGEAIAGRQVLCEECRAQDFFDVVQLLGTAIAR